MTEDLLHDAVAGCAAGHDMAEHAPALLHALLDESVPAEGKAAFLRALARKGESPAELAAFASAILPRAVDPGVQGSFQGRNLIDCCGTGGGGLNIVNISTGMVFLLAACGAPVVKHGNRGLTKKSGSSDVLRALGVSVEIAPDRVVEALEKVGCVFLFAPAFHPAFKVIAPIRQALAAEGQRTIFNLLGPLLNPARPASQMMGVFQPAHLPLFTGALTTRGCRRFLLVYGSTRDGQALGEASADGPTELLGRLDGIEIHETRHSRAQGEWRSLEITDHDDSARRLLGVLEGAETGLLRAMVVENAALALWVQGTAASIDEGRARAEEALDSGRALGVLHRWREWSRA